MTSTVYEELLTPKQAAKLLGISPVTVRLWANRGFLKVEHTVGGHRRFIRQDVEALLEKSLHQPEERLSIVVVDDDKSYMDFLREYLSLLSPSILVETADEPFRAGQLIERLHPDVVLMDLMMPRVNGFQLCSYLKSQPETKSIRIIAMTGHFSQANQSMVKQAGAETCLKKPIPLGELIEALKIDKYLSKFSPEKFHNEAPVITTDSDK